MSKLSQARHSYYIDLHCHLDLYPNFEELILECERSKIFTLAVTTTPRAWSRNYALMENLKFVRPALGLHPQLINESSTSEWLLFKKLIPNAKYIGEVGLDGSRDYAKNFETQKDIFKETLLLCSQYGPKILSVHLVRAVRPGLDIIEEHADPTKIKVLLHWFTGTKHQAERAIKMGCYFSINSKMLESRTFLETLKQIPLDRLVIETDGPFVKDSAQTPLDPRSSQEIVTTMSKVLNIHSADLKNIIFNNFMNIIQ